MLISLQEAAQAAGAEILRFRDTTLTGASYDNRLIRRGELFVAIKGDRSDGHEYARAAAEAGAGAVLAERDPFNGGESVPVLLADDSVRALGRIAHHFRKKFPGKVAGITGTAGKTTTKELLASILSVHGKTARSLKNLNTQVGMPVSILHCDGDEAFWVLEAGISHPEDMDELGPVMEPDIAVVLNAGAGHSLGLGGGGAAHYKSRLLKHVADGGKALVSADYPELVREALAVRKDVLFFTACGADAPYAASYRGMTGDGRGIYEISINGRRIEACSPLAGRYAAENIAAAAAVADLFGLAPDEIARGISGASVPDQRLSKKIHGGWTILDDTYNANPLSMERMIEAAREQAAGGTLVLVLAEMLELGDEAARAHREAGRQAARSGCKAVFWHGGHAEDVRMGLEDEEYGGIFSILSSHADFPAAFRKAGITSRDDGPGVVLFKGSRGNHMEKLVTTFTENF